MFKKNLILSLVALVLSFTVFMLTKVYVVYSVLLGLGVASMVYLILTYITTYKRYKNASKKAYNIVQGIPAKSGLVLVLVVLILSIILCYFVDVLSSSVILNIVLAILVALVDVYSVKNAYIFVEGNNLVVGKEIPLDKIVRYIAYKNKKGVYKQMQIIYDGGSRDLYVSYSKELEDLLDSLLSRKKRGY